MKFEDLTEEFLSERATKEDIFEVDGTRFRAIYNEGLNVYKLFYADSKVDPYSEDYEWIEVYFADEEEEPSYWDVLRYEDKIEKSKSWWDVVGKPRQEEYVECPEWLRH